VTAYARATDRDQALEAGYDAHVPKPIEADELLQTIVKVVTQA
jgi:CheY-like chemotaxis protein